MTLQELLEHAHLDALGQLDEREQAAFEAAFAVAPPAVRAQVRNEQARWAPMEHLLPQVEPSPELRGRVLDAVTAAMVAQGAGELSMRPSRRVAPAWRATSIGLMTAVVVLGSAFMYVVQTTDQSNRTRNNDQTREYMLQAFKRNVRSAMMSELTVRAPFKASSPDCQGAVWTNEEWDTGYAFVELPKSAEGEEYRLVVMGSDGSIERVLVTFASNGVLQTQEFPKQPGSVRLAVVSAFKNSQQSSMKDLLLTVTL